MKTNLSGKCTAIVQIRFAGTQPHPVLCAEPGKFRPSLIYSGAGIVRCDEHHVEFTGRYRGIREDVKLNHVSFELPIPGVW